jgi:hypothetical protein
VLECEEDTGAVDGKDVVPVIQFQFVQRLDSEARFGDTRVRVHHVNPSEVIDRRPHQCFHIGLYPHIGVDGERLASGSDDFRCDLLGSPRDVVAGDDLCPFTRIEQGALPA